MHATKSMEWMVCWGRRWEKQNFISAKIASTDDLHSTPIKSTDQNVYSTVILITKSACFDYDE